LVGVQIPRKPPKQLKEFEREKMMVKKITNKSQANLELFLTNRRIEKTFNNLHNSDDVDGIIMRKLEKLWHKRKLLIDFMEGQ